MSAVKKHFVTFYSPGSFFAEDTTKPISSWDTEKAMKMAHDVVERYGATPFAFRFSTRERKAKDLDSKETKTSGMYFLGGKIETLAQVKKRPTAKTEDRILISNMEGNKWNKIITNNNSWKTVQPFREDEGDVLLDWKPRRKRERKASSSA